MDGLVLYDLPDSQSLRLLRWAEGEAMRKAWEKAARPDSERSERVEFFCVESHTPAGAGPAAPASASLPVERVGCGVQGVSG
jgi:hypothetical protein